MNRILILSGKALRSQVAEYFESLCRQHGDILIQKFTEPKFCLEKTPWLIIRAEPDHQSPVGHAEDF